MSIAVFFLLVVRSFFVHRDRVENEKRWYIKNLNFEFSGRVDSVHASKRRGLLYFQITHGETPKSTKEHLNKQLKHNGNLRFIIFTRDEKLAILMEGAGKCIAGDSIQINTNENEISVYRNKILISKAEAVKSLIGRPF